MLYLGDFAAGATIYFKFTTNLGTGARADPSTAFEAADVRVYKNGSTTERSSSAGVTVTSTFDSMTGITHVTIDTSDNTDAGFYAAGNDYDVVLYPDETVDGVSVAQVVAHFSIDNRGILRPTVAGRTLDVTATGAAGIDFGNAENITTTLNFSGMTIKTATDVEADTADIQSRIPAALVSGRIDAYTGAAADGVFTAAKFAAGAFDAVWSVGTRVLTAGTNIVLAKGVGVTGFNDITTAQVNAEADQALADAGVTTTRMGYLDKLNISGNVASSGEVTSIQNNTRCVRAVPSVVERPDAGSTTIRIELLLYDDVGNMEAPDAAPTIGVVNQDGTSRNANLDSTTMTLVSTGRYRAIYTVADDHEVEELVVHFGVVEGGASRDFVNVLQVVDTSAVDFTSADRAMLAALHDVRLTADRASYLDELAAANIPADIDTLKGRIPGTIQPQTGDAFARLGAPAGASVSADNAATKSVVDAVKLKTDNLPESPAAVGSAMTLEAGERTTLVAAIWNALTSGFGTAGSIGLRIVNYLTGDSFARLGAPAGASVAADIAEINAKTQNLPASPASQTTVEAVKSQTDLLTFSGSAVSANVTKIGGSTAHVDKMAYNLTVVMSGTVHGTFTPTTTQFESGDLPVTAADRLNGRVVAFVDGDNIYEFSRITDCAIVSGRTRLTVQTLTGAPVAGVRFLVL